MTLAELITDLDAGTLDDEAFIAACLDNWSGRTEIPEYPETDRSLMPKFPNTATIDSAVAAGELDADLAARVHQARWDSLAE